MSDEDDWAPQFQPTRWQWKPTPEQEREDRARRRVAEDAARYALEKERIEVELGGLLGKMGVPSRYAELIECQCDEESDWKETPAVKAVEEALKERSVFIVLAGACGVGKTAAAVHWLRKRTGHFGFVHLLGRGKPDQDTSLFVTAEHLATWPRYKRKEMARLEEAFCLVIDDLGVEYDDKSGNFRSLFDSLMNHRYAEQSWTCITTNLSAVAFRERYGERVVDRIREVGEFYEFNGPSLRVKPGTLRAV